MFDRFTKDIAGNPLKKMGAKWRPVKANANDSATKIPAAIRGASAQSPLLLDL